MLCTVAVAHVAAVVVAETVQIGLLQLLLCASAAAKMARRAVVAVAIVADGVARLLLVTAEAGVI